MGCLALWAQLHAGEAKRANEKQPGVSPPRIRRAATDIVPRKPRKRRIVDPGNQVANAEHPQGFGHDPVGATAGHAP